MRKLILLLLFPILGFGQTFEFGTCAIQDHPEYGTPLGRAWAIFGSGEGFALPRDFDDTLIKPGESLIIIPDDETKKELILRVRQTFDWQGNFGILFDFEPFRSAGVGYPYAKVYRYPEVSVQYDIPLTFVAVNRYNSIINFAYNHTRNLFSIGDIFYWNNWPLRVSNYVPGSSTRIELTHECDLTNADWENEIIYVKSALTSNTFYVD